jgi:hypothetical protein
MRHTPSDVTGQPAPRWRPTRSDRRARAGNRRRPAASRPAASAIASLANRRAR